MCADRYWVGGTANWDGIAGSKWSATSGGAGGVSVPGGGDAVFFDGNSGSGTVTISADASCASLNCTGFTGTISGTSNIGIYAGGLILSAAMTWSHTTGVIFFLASSGSHNITSSGKTLSYIVVSASGADYILQDALTSSGIEVSAGELDLNGQNVTAGQFSVFGGTLTFSASTVYVTAVIGNGNVFIDTDATINAAGSTLVLQGLNDSIWLGGKIFGTLQVDSSLQSAGSFYVLQDSGTVDVLTINVSAPIKTASLLMVPGITLTIISELNLIGYSQDNNDDAGLIRTGAGTNPIVSSTGATVTCRNAQITNVNATGGADFTVEGSCTISGTSTGWSTPFNPMQMAGD